MIILCVLQDACRELFCVLRDFYASGTQDAEVTKSLPVTPVMGVTDLTFIVKLFEEGISGVLFGCKLV